jgi:putative flippase GtrA
MIRLIRYFFVGAASALVDIGLFIAIFAGLGLNWFVASTISFTTATVLNYFLSIRHVFESGARYVQHHELALVFLISGLGLFINQAVLYALFIIVGLNVLVSKVAATGLVFFWNFGARQKFIFGPTN